MMRTRQDAVDGVGDGGPDAWSQCLAVTNSHCDHVPYCDL